MDQSHIKCTLGDELVLSVDAFRWPICSHGFCKECLSQWVSRATDFEDEFPPRCCGVQILADTVRGFLPNDLVQKLERKSVEFTTVDRTYCAKPGCSTFIPPTQVENNIGKCEACRNETCSVCKKEKHEGQCIVDDDSGLLLELARTNQWQRCSACGRLVERTEGCNHIVCVCNAEFCYVCGKVWATCSCAEADDVDDMEELAPAAPAPTAIMQDDYVVGVRGLFYLNLLGRFPGDERLQAQNPRQAIGLRLSILTAELAVARDLVSQIRGLARDFGDIRWPGQSGNPRLVEQLLVGLREEEFRAGNQTRNEVYRLRDTERRAIAYENVIQQQLDHAHAYNGQLVVDVNDARRPRHPLFIFARPEHP